MSIIDIRVINIAIFGDTMTGKTCLINKYIGINNMHTLATIGIDFTIKNIKRSDNINYKLKIWDTSGVEIYQSMALNLLKNIKGLILVYSIDNKSTLENINKLINKINNFIDISEIPIILVGNKKDLNNQRIVSEEEGRKIAEDYNFNFFETCAETGENINETFQKLFEIIIKNLKSHNNNNNIHNNNNNIHVNNIHNKNNYNNNKIDKEGKCLII